MYVRFLNIYGIVYVSLINARCTFEFAIPDISVTDSTVYYEGPYNECKVNIVIGDIVYKI